MADKNNLYFHSAEVYIKASGDAPTPRRVAIIQEVSIEIKKDPKELMGENTYAEDVASGNQSISGKYKSGELDPSWIGENFLDADRTEGSLVLERGEVHTVATGAVTVTHAADFSEDYGVINGATGQVWVRIPTAGTLAAGKYKLNEATGVYTFHADDNGKALSFTYMRESEDGETFTVSNKLAGDSVYCSLLLYKTSRTGKGFGLRLASAMFESVSFGFKLGEYAMPEGSFKGFAGDNGRVFQIFRG